MRKINLSFILGLLLLASVSTVTYLTMQDIVELGHSERHVYQVQAKLNDIRNPLKDAEAGHRGFLLSGEEDYLKKYHQASKNIQKQLSDLNKLLSNDRSQQKNLGQLKELTSLKFKEMDLSILEMRKGNTDTALELFFKENAVDHLNTILLLIDSIDKHEEETLHSNMNFIEKSVSRSMKILGLGSTWAFTIVLFASYYFYLERKRRIQSEIFLRQAREEAIRASHAKSEFLANISHEIRTPLNGIISTADLFENSERLSPEDRHFVHIIRTSGESLLRIVNEVLDFSKIEAGKLNLEVGVFSPEHILRFACDLFEARAKNKGLQISTFISDKVPPQALGDGGRISQVLANFISNAVKFSDQGEINASIEIAQDYDTQSKLLRFSISDFGPGLDPNLKENLFKPFSQSSTTNGSKNYGTGLGLAISKKLVDLMKGTIGVKSDAGKGATFYFEIPLVLPSITVTEKKITENKEDSATQKKQASRKFSTWEVHSKGASVLVAEDDPVNQIVIREHLKRFHISADIVDNGKQALIAAQKNEYKIILMDCQMPEMNGFEASQEIHKINPHIPIVAMTASALPGDKERCAAAGMNTQLIKPIRKNDLEIVLKSYFLTNEIPAYSSIKWEILKKLAEQTDLLTIQKVVDSFLETLPNALDSIISSQANQDLEKIKQSAHRLKSGSSTIGAIKLSSICENLEKTPQNTELVDQLQKEASLLQIDLQFWNKNIS